ncbi:hypothetical protein SASPL_118023 [Salvia splendens]|uniref:Shikimate O-hydroxycinnamoyltransferase n=1 Tax=Salvia splendens TaxID=180675 RepID=A0A8X8XVZ1_SALSN|nr:hypothetical protein SASPL_118023 [Salvia splendens]
MAGKLDRDAKGCIEIDCNGEGAAFVEAEAEADLNDLGDFAPYPDFCLTPKVDYSQGISSFPLLLVQYLVVVDCLYVLRYFFLCGLVILIRGDTIQMRGSMPRCCNGSSSEGWNFRFAYSLNVVRNSSQPRYWRAAVLGLPCPGLSLNSTTPRNQADDYSRRAVRLQPPLPPGYFGNAVYKASDIALSGEVESKPLNFTIGKIREAVARMDDEYLRIAIDYLGVEGGLHPNARGTGLYKSPNLGITSWARLPFYEVDFGWGRPFYVGLGALPAEGHLIVMPTPVNDGSLALAIVLPEEQMKVFENIFYDI